MKSRVSSLGIALAMVLSLVAVAPAGADSHPYLRAEPWGGFPPNEPTGSYLAGINGWENEVDKFRFQITVESDHQPVTIEWSSPTLPGNPESGNLPADAFIGGIPVGVNETMIGGTTFEWNPGEDRGSNEVNCYYPATGNTSAGNCYWVRITATDALGQSTSVDVYLRVLEDVNPPDVEILDMSPVDGVVAIGETITFTVQGTDTDIPTSTAMEYELMEFGPEGSPAGATIHRDTGDFSWTPAAGQDGSYLLPILVQEHGPGVPADQLGTAFVEVPIVVGSGNRPPVVEVSTPVVNVGAGDLVEIEFFYYDLDFTNQDLTAGLVGAPEGAGLYPEGSPDTFVWSTDADDDGKRFDFHLEVSDGIDTTSVPMTVIVGTVQDIQISITESIAVAESVAITPPVEIFISESVGVSDGVSIDAGVIIQISESIGVADTVEVRPPVQISITESVVVADDVTTTPPVLIAISESVGVADSVVATPPLTITITESIAVDDAAVVTPAALGSISGVKWADLDGDATKENGEPPLEGVTIYLDLDDDGAHDTDEPSAVSAADGSYTFADLAPGLWVVREVVPDGYTQTFPSMAQQGEHRVNIVGSDPVADIDFGNQPTTSSTPPAVIKPIDDVVLDVGEFVEIGFELEGDPDPSLYDHQWEGYPPTAVINGVIPYMPAPDDAGRTFFVTLTVTAKDDPSNFDTEEFSITVNPLNEPATIAPIDDAFGLPGENIVVELDISDPEGDPYTKVWIGPPPNAVINGIFILNPDADQAGKAFPIILQIVQNGETVATETFTVFVGGEPTVPGGAPTIPPVGGAGEVIPVEGSGLEPGSGAGIFLFSEPVLLKTVTAGPNGTFKTTVDLPLDTTGGEHTIVVMGTSAAGEPISLVANLEVIDDQDEDGLTEFEETVVGTDRTDPDSDGDGIVDGIDPSWLGHWVTSQSDEVFKSRLAKLRLRLKIASIHTAIAFGDRSAALFLIDSLERRTNGCGTSPDRGDWVVDCDGQAEFRELMVMLEGNVAVIELPEPPRWWE